MLSTNSICNNIDTYQIYSFSQFEKELEKIKNYNKLAINLSY